MNGTVVNTYKQYALEKMFGGDDQPYAVCLLRDAITVDRNLTLSICLANESTFGGYTRALIPGIYGSSINGDNLAESDFEDAEFSCGDDSGQYAYGAFLLAKSETELVFAVLFDSPILMSNGTILRVSSKVLCGSLYNN